MHVLKIKQRQQLNTRACAPKVASINNPLKDRRRPPGLHVKHVEHAHCCAGPQRLKT